MTARARLHRGVRIVMPGQLRPALAAAVLIAVGGCSSAPSRNILGSYFPSWMVCALVGLGAAAIMRRLLIKAGIDQELPAPVVVYIAVATAFALALWLLWLA